MTAVREKAEKLAFDKGYRVDTEGQVVSPTGRIRKLRPDRNGYLTFGVRDYDRKHRHCYVHRLAGFEKFGSAIHAEGIQVRHLDGDHRNNKPSNVGVGSASQNTFDKPKSTRVRVAGNANRRHDHAGILASYRSSGFSETQRRFSLSKSTLAFIVKRSLAVANPANGRAS